MPHNHPISIEQFNLPGAALLVRTSNKQIISYQEGLSNIENSTQITPYHYFQNGHITRLFTAVILVKLAEEHRLDLDLPLEPLARQHQMDQGRLQFLVNQYPLLKPVSVRQLLNHTSGIPSYTKTEGYYYKFINKPKKIFQAEAYLDLITGNVRYPFNYEPLPRGIFSESATNYIIAGWVIEAITGRSLAEEMQDLFNSVNLRQTFYCDQGVFDREMLEKKLQGSSHLVHGYLPLSHPYAEAFSTLPVFTYNNNRELQVHDVTFAYNFNELGGGASFSTLNDLIIWIDHLMNGAVLKSGMKDLFNGVPVSPRAQIKPSFLNPDLGPEIAYSKEHYGLGLYKTISKRFGEIVWASGNSFGYGVLVGHFVNKNISFALGINVSRYPINLHEPEWMGEVLQKVVES